MKGDSAPQLRRAVRLSLADLPGILKNQIIYVLDFAQAHISLLLRNGYSANICCNWGEIA